MLLDIVSSSRSRITKSIVTPSSPLIRDVEWRFGVISSRGSVEAGIILRIDTTTGIFFVGVGLKAFHKLRFAVATAFIELISLQDKLQPN